MTYYCDAFRHLICVPYSIPALHEMASALKIKRCWFHAGKFPHYDIPKRRYAEIAHQCTLLPQRDLLAIIQSALVVDTLQGDLTT